MESVPSLREVFEALAGSSADPAAALESAGHGDLPGDLVAEAIVNYADAAPVEVAEHLSPFVIAHSAVPHADEGSSGTPDTDDGLSLLSSAPAGSDPESEDFDASDLTDLNGFAADAEQPAQGGPAEGAPGLESESTDDGGHDHTQDPADLFFGAGQPAAGAPAADRPVPTTESGEEATAGFDPATLDAASSPDGSWLDVTGAALDADTDSETDWTHGDAADAGHVPLDRAVDDEPGGDDTIDGAGA